MFGRRKAGRIGRGVLGTGALTLVFLKCTKINNWCAIGFCSHGCRFVAAMLVIVLVGHLVHMLTRLLRWHCGRLAKSTRARFYIAFQLLGAWAAYGLYTFFVNSITAAKEHLLWSCAGCEAVGAFVLALAWAAVTFPR